MVFMIDINEANAVNILDLYKKYPELNCKLLNIVI